jgi:hypothetical protein
MSRTVNLDVLDRISIASPCTADWASMTGDERVRFCSECRLNVYNLSAMSREDAAALIVEREGCLCVRFYRRADGTVLTQDCPVGLRALRRKAAAGLARAGAAAALLLSTIVTLGAGRPTGWSVRLRQIQPFARVCEWISPTPIPPPIMVGKVSRSSVMGAVALPITQTPAPQPRSH